MIGGIDLNILILMSALPEIFVRRIDFKLRRNGLFARREQK